MNPTGRAPLIAVAWAALSAWLATACHEVYGGGDDVYENFVLPDCEVCDLLGHMAPPASVFVAGGEADACTPVPENCPWG